MTRILATGNDAVRRLEHLYRYGADRMSGRDAREVHPDLESATYGLLVRLDGYGRQRATDLAVYIGVGRPPCPVSCVRWRNWVWSPANRTPPTGGPGCAS